MAATATQTPALAPADAATPVAAPAPRPQRVLTRNFGINLDGYKSREWHYEVPETQSREDLLRPEFWADISDKIVSLADDIKIWQPNNGWKARASIEGFGKGYVKLKFYSEKAGEVADTSTGPLTVRWNPGRKCHEVIRASNKAVMATGFQQNSDAVAWIENHRKEMAA